VANPPGLAWTTKTGTEGVTLRKVQGLKMHSVACGRRALMRLAREKQGK
jgi:hypothetical protein